MAAKMSSVLCIKQTEETTGALYLFSLPSASAKKPADKF